MAWGRKTKIEFAEKSDKIDQLQSEIQRLTQENTELQLVISSLEGLLPEQSGKIDEQESAIQRLTQENAELQSVKSSLEEKSKEHLRELAEKGDKIAKLQSIIQRLTKENAELQLVNSSLEDLAQENSDLQLDNSSLEGQLTEQSGKIDELQSAIQRLNRENAELQSVNSSLEGKSKEHLRELTEQGDKIDELQSIIQRLTQENAELQSVNSSLEEQSNKHLRELRDKNDELLCQMQSVDQMNIDITNKTKELDERQSQLSNLRNDLLKKDGLIAERERAVKEREIEADCGFASRNRIFLQQLEQREKLVKEREDKLTDRENTFHEKFTQLEKKDQEIWNREVKVKEAEIRIEQGFSEKRQNLEKELEIKRESFEKELLELYVKRKEELDKQIEDVRSQRLCFIEQEINDIRNERIRQEELRIMLEKRSEDLDIENKILEADKEKLYKRESQIEDEVNRRIAEREKSFECEERRLKDECQRLRESVSNTSTMLSIYDELKRKLGDDEPEDVLNKLIKKEEELRRLRNQLLEPPSNEILAWYDEELNHFKIRCKELEDERIKLQRQLEPQDQKKYEIGQLKIKIKSLETTNRTLESEYKQIESKLNRFQKIYSGEQDGDERIRRIERPQIIFDKKPTFKEVNEIEWLKQIDVDCRNYGLKFPKRLLYAFHTALKTAEWSPLTVLAGVSGTGKSELPRLYSHFGGLNFLSLAVQPNWDSQESMLGFFNSIDNSFDAQPVLNLLAQSQKDSTQDYPYGLKDAMVLILMDEMNLAHVELYFSEFLSKLELRRGSILEDIPKLDVKLGTNHEVYKLPLGRNVLWTGTMNQDETTKSLSDKVLDRGILIFFPRPTNLERRRILKPLGKLAPLLHRKTWEQWWSKESTFTEEEIRPYKGFIEEINKNLERVGRALGHRVWQSIEYYMANYPDVRYAQEKHDNRALKDAMRIAFEDQLVQKVMPKLRGIETRGQSKSECLDKILLQLESEGYSIVDDFKTACEFGYGQFMWNSANYLRKHADLVDNDNIDNDPINQDMNNDDKLNDNLIDQEYKGSRLTKKQQKMMQNFNKRKMVD
jgi:hypothetical protein